MKFFIVFLLATSCAATTQVEHYSRVGVSNFDKECYREYIADFKAISRCEKTFVNYFEKKIAEEFRDKEWRSCNEILNEDQKHYAAKYWALQGWKSISQDQRKTACDIQGLLIKAGESTEEQRATIFLITLSTYYSQNNFDLCAYNPNIHRF